MKFDENLVYVWMWEKSKGDDLSCKWLWGGYEFLYLSKDFVSEYFLFVNYGED